MNEGVEELFGSYLKEHQMKVIRSAEPFFEGRDPRFRDTRN